MRRATAASRKGLGAVLPRPLPFSFLAGAILFLGASAQAYATPRDALAQWRDYALSRITPHYSWAGNSPGPTRVPSVMDRAYSSSASLVLGNDGARQYSLQIESAPTRTLVRSESGHPSASPLLDDLGSPIGGRFTNTGLVTELADGTQLGVSVVFAYQRFAAPGFAGFADTRFADAMGSVVAPGAYPSYPLRTLYGNGVRLNAQTPVNSQLSWYASYRSRIKFDSYQNYRGVYGNPGDFDIPASVGLGLDFHPLTRVNLRLGAERVMYSEIQPFVSSALPRRFLALLGDGASPDFTWRDLDIYSATLGLDAGAGGRWSLRYSTREQPEPTSQLLSQLLLSQAPDYSVSLGFSHSLGLGELNFAANYAPSAFILGIPTSASNSERINQRPIEFEALWSMAF